jgi:predicted aspartyl protease
VDSVVIEPLEIGTICLMNVRAFVQQTNGENIFGMSELKKLELASRGGTKSDEIAAADRKHSATTP